MIKAQRNALKHMKVKGIVPLHQILDNEISETKKEEILATNMSYQLVPPNNQRGNIYERAIQSCNNNFIGVRAGTAATFPLHLWCQIIPQAERQLLLLSQTNINRNISAYDYVYGQHDYNAAPFVLWSMINPIEERLSPKTAERATSSEVLLDITVRGLFGC